MTTSISVWRQGIYRHLVLLITLLSLSVPFLGYAGLDAGRAAYYQGDYAKAYEDFKPLADGGDASAQYHLGLMYANGYGVAEDYSEAAKWFRRAAEQENPDAQSALGGMYAFGQGVPQDLVLAYMWLNLAATQGNSEAESLRDEIAETMTRSQVAEAQRLAREWKPKGQ